MSLKLDKYAAPPTDAAPNVVPPLAPINGDDGKPAILRVSDTLTLAVCSRTASGEPVLARFRPAREASEGKEARAAGYVLTGRIADFARAIAGGLLA